MGLKRKVLYSHIKPSDKCITSGFCWGVDKICTLTGYYAVCSGNSLPIFRDNVLFPSARVRILNCWRWEWWVVPKCQLGIATTRYIISQKSADLKRHKFQKNLGTKRHELVQKSQMPVSLLNSIISKKEAQEKASQKWGEETKKIRKIRSSSILRNRKHVSGAVQHKRLEGVVVDGKVSWRLPQT